MFIKNTDALRSHLKWQSEAHRSSLRNVYVARCSIWCLREISITQMLLSYFSRVDASSYYYYIEESIKVAHCCCPIQKQKGKGTLIQNRKFHIRISNTCKHVVGDH